MNAANARTMSAMNAIRNRVQAARRWCGDQSAPRSSVERQRLAVAAMKMASQLTSACVGAAAQQCAGCRPSWLTIERFLDAADPRAAFLEWSDAFVRHVTSAHQEPIAERAAAIVRREPQRRWRWCELSSALGVSAAALRRQFRDRFRLSLNEFVHLLRSAKAIGMCVPGMKVESIARDLGYRSKKDFYAALARWTSITPANLRRLSDAERVRLQTRLQRAIDGERDERARNDQRRDRRRPARTSRTASVPATSAAPPTSATPA